MLDKTETLVESGTRRLKGMKAKANQVPAATCQITLLAVRVNRVEKWVNGRTLADSAGLITHTILPKCPARSFVYWKMAG